MKFKIGDKVVENRKAILQDLRRGNEPVAGVLEVVSKFFEANDLIYRVKDSNGEMWLFKAYQLDLYTSDYANVDIKAQIRSMELKHGREVVLQALEEYLKESGASE